MSKLLDEKEFEVLLRICRRKRVYFAFGLGRKPEDHMLILHRKLKGKALFQALKRETDGIVKGTWGIVSTTPKKIIFKAEKQIPSLKMSIRRFLKTRGIELKPVLLDAKGGEVLDSVDDVDAITRTVERGEKKKKKVAKKPAAGRAKEDAEAGDGETEGRPSPRQRALRKQLQRVMKKVRRAVRDAIRADPGRKDELAGPLVQAERQLEADELDDAKTTVLQLGRMLRG
jgi:hypothetical protein